MKLCKIIFKNNKALFSRKEVKLTECQFALLKGKGEGAHVFIREEHLKFKNDKDRENYKQNTSRSLHTE